MKSIASTERFELCALAHVVYLPAYLAKIYTQSQLFPRRPAGRLPSICLNPQKEVPIQPQCDEFDELDKLIRLHCHSAVGFPGLDEAFGQYERGVLAHHLSDLKNDVDTEWLMIYNRIYNVTKYVSGLKNETTGSIEENSKNAYLNEDLNSLIINARGQDATEVYEALYNDDVALSCMDDLFYVGVMDEEESL